MQRRSTVLKTKLAQANHELQLAMNARSSSLLAVSLNPADDKAHETLDASIVAVPALQTKVEALESAVHEAERLDRADAIDARRAGWLAARDRAVELSAARTVPAKALQASVDAMGTALHDMEKANDEVLQAIYEATQGAAPDGEHDGMVFGQRLGSVTGSVTAALCGAFPAALHDAGLGEVGIDLTGWIGYVHPAADRSGLVAAVEQSSKNIAQTLDFLHKSVGILPPDPVEEAAPLTTPPTETVLPDGTIYTVDAVETTWGAPK